MISQRSSTKGTKNLGFAKTLDFIYSIHLIRGAVLEKVQPHLTYHAPILALIEVLVYRSGGHTCRYLRITFGLLAG
jgi:hypothetical protein